MKINLNEKSADALAKQLRKAAEMAEALKTDAGKDACTSICEVLRELSLARMGGFNE